MITIEYDCWDVNEEFTHDSETFDTEEELQDYLGFMQREMDIYWETVRVTDSNGRQRIAKIILQEA